MSSGNKTIYLVGSPGVDVIFNESVQITMKSFIFYEDIEFLNEIRPYPGHSIIWQPNGNYDALHIDKLWWKVSGDGGSLEFRNFDSSITGLQTKTLRVAAKGAILSNLVFHNNRLSLNSQIRIDMGTSLISGVLVEGITFKGEQSMYDLQVLAYCISNCENTTFTNKYGLDKRVWIKNNIFLKTTNYYIYAYHGNIIEGNYFKGSTSSAIWIVEKDHDGFSFFNNVFEMTNHWNAIIYYNYIAETVSEVNGINRFYNNLVSNNGYNLNHVFLWRRNKAQHHDNKPTPFYFYNNIIEGSSTCENLVRCNQFDTKNVAVTDIRVRNNLFTNPSCSFNVWKLDMYDNCNVTVLVDEGDNIFGKSVSFNNSVDSPFPKFELLKDVIGMTFSNPPNTSFFTNPWLLPDHDFMDRKRPGISGSMNRSSRGPFEFQKEYARYPLCNNPKTFCVEVDVDYPCYECISTSISWISSNFDSTLSEGSCTIFLVGDPSVYVSLNESVVLASISDSDYEKANIIQVYPGHSIIWGPNKNSSDVNTIEVTGYWWKITGEGGDLVLINHPYTEKSKNIVYVNTIAIILTNLTIRNYRHSLTNLILTKNSVFLGFLIEGVKFEGEDVYSSINNYLGCDLACSASTFVTEFGEHRRMWIRRNVFDITSMSHLEFHQQSYVVIEENFFTNGVGNCISLYSHGSQKGFNVFNNVFLLTGGWYSVIYDSYRSNGYFGENEKGMKRFFNNLVVLGTHYLTQLVLQDNGVSSENFDHPAYPIYVYNNLFETTTNCVNIIGCGAGGNDAPNMKFRNNRISKASCTPDDFYAKMLTSCNKTLTYSVEDLGNNHFGDIDFYGSGDIPFPKYDLASEYLGIEFETPDNRSWARNKWILPEYDFEGRRRPNHQSGNLNFSSLGPFEFQGVYRDFPCCDNTNAFCVQVSNFYPCYNCHSTKIKDITDGSAFDGTGNKVIYLVGTNGTTLNFSESVVIDKKVTEADFSSANIIQPYPGHSINWLPDGDSPNLRIIGHWWKIDGGGSLELMNLPSVSTTTPIIDIDSSGILLTNFTITNKKDSLYEMVRTSERIPFLGALFESLTFSGERYEKGLVTKLFCNNSCVSTSFTNFYGLDKRLLIRNNIFKSRSVYPLDASPLAFTVEGNYFSNELEGNGFINNFAIAEDGFSVFNNVFVLRGGTCKAILYFRYQPYTVSYGKNRFFNNLISFDFMNSAATLSVFNQETGFPEKPNELYIYNNLISSPNKCNYITDCIGGSDSSASNVYFQHNRHSNKVCNTSSDWISTNFGTVCNESFSHTEDLGNNLASQISFLFSGEEPFPYFDLSQDVVGLAFKTPVNTSWSNPWILSDHDYEGKSRHSGDLLNRTTVGPLQFLCPQGCFSGGMFHCQTDQCSCVQPFFGENCEFSNLYCPNCHDHGNCSGNPKDFFSQYSCSCQSPKLYWGDFCNETFCFGVSSNESNVCSSHGDCLKFDVCNCWDGYFGLSCNITLCKDIFSNTSQVCGGKRVEDNHQ